MAEDKKPETKAERSTPDEVIATQRNKQLMILVAVIVVLAGLVAITNLTREEETPLQEIMLVGGTRENPTVTKDEIKRIQIWKGSTDDRFELYRDGDDWTVPSRFDAPADKDDVDALLDKVLRAARLNRPSTTEAGNYALYGLDEESGVHLRVVNDKDQEVLHVLLGRGEVGSRDFVRLMGDDAPEGIFELAGLGGEFDTIYSTLNLDSTGKTRAGSWIDTSGFEVLPFDAVVESLELQDGTSTLQFQRKPNTQPADDEWMLTSPRQGEADGAAVHAIVDALRTYSITDIAGPDTDAPKYGLSFPEKKVSFAYLDGEKLVRASVSFGKVNDESEVPVWLSSVNKGKFIYWGGDFILSRVFRNLFDLMAKERVELVPPGTNADSITVVDGAMTTRLERKSEGAASSWTVAKPYNQPGDQLEVSNLLTTLNTLQGYRPTGESDLVSLGLGAGVSSRSITIVYPGKKAEDSDGDDTPDTPPDDGTEGGDATDDVSDEEATEPPPPPVMTATLYFGKLQGNELPVLRVTPDSQQVLWLKIESIEGLFRFPGEYLKLGKMNLLETGNRAVDVLVTNESSVLQLTLVGEDGAEKLWHIKQPWDEVADQSEASRTISTLSRMQAVKLDAPLDKTVYALGEGVSTRQVDLQYKNGDNTGTVTLYLGKALDGMVTSMVKRGDVEEFYLVKPGDLFQLFVSPKDLRVLPTYSGKVRHILISWKWKFEGVNPKDPQRTEAEAWALAEDIVKRARAGEDFVELQKQYNEDGDATHVYDVSPTESLVKPFLRLSSELKVGEVGTVESNFGIHVIKRIE
ncbi:MAG: DUF4340 domain-containing protein [Planctomycetes bacterium]|nr:DUF4340 domain-containing protein [Planctomycetota bacterium]